MGANLFGRVLGSQTDCVLACTQNAKLFQAFYYRFLVRFPIGLDNRN